MTTMNAKIGEWIELHEESGLLEIVSGAVELYVVYSPGGVKNRRVFLCEETAGDFLCAIPASAGAPELSLLAIATAETTLRPVTQDELKAESRSRQAAALERVSIPFFCRPSRPLLPRVCREFSPGERAELPAGTRLAVPKGRPLAWLEVPQNAVHADASARFIGDCNLLLLPARESIALEEAAKVAAFSTAEILERFDAKILLAAIEKEIGLFCRAWLDFFHAEERKEKERLSEFARTKELLVANSYSELLKNLIPDLPFIQRAEDVNQPPVIHALRKSAITSASRRAVSACPKEPCLATANRFAIFRIQRTRTRLVPKRPQ